MKRFSYICADAGIPIPGNKGASIHVESTCRALAAAGLSGEILTVRPEAASLSGIPIRPIRVEARGDGGAEERELRLFLSGFDAEPAVEPDSDFVYERYSLWHVGGLARARRRKIPFVLEVNSPLPDEARRYRTLYHEELAEALSRVLLQEANGVVCVSDEIARWVHQRRGSDTGVWVVPNGVDAELFSPRSAARPDALPPAPVPLIAFVGSFRPWHGVEDLLRAYSLLLSHHDTDAHLLCIGDGPLRQTFEDQARELGIADRVHVTGLVRHEEVPVWLGCADIAVAPYPQPREFYFSPLKVYEAMALALPLVAADVGQISRVVTADRGRLFPAGDQRAFADAMAWLLDRPDEARRLGAAGRAWVLANATWSKRVASVLDRIETL